MGSSTRFHHKIRQHALILVKTLISENIKANLKTDRINRKNNDEVMNTTQKVNWVCIYQCKNKKDTPSQKRMTLKPIKGNAHYRTF